MQNKCLIIMPSGEPSGYPQGHVGRVYEYIIAPACRQAGYIPERVDNAVNDQPFDIVKEIIDSDVAILDLSANNVNAHYGLAIRHSLNLPVVLTKDVKSVVNFFISDLDIVDYDDSLRIDTVQKATEALSAALKSAVENKKEKHELLGRLSIGVSAPEPIIENSHEETTVQEPEAEVKKPRLPVISPLPDNVGQPLTAAEIDRLKPGDVFFHLNFGEGKINFIKKNKLASIQFESGEKFLVLTVSDFFRKIIS